MILSNQNQILNLQDFACQEPNTSTAISMYLVGGGVIPLFIRFLSDLSCLFALNLSKLISTFLDLSPFFRLIQSNVCKVLSALAIFAVVFSYPCLFAIDVVFKLISIFVTVLGGTRQSYSSLNITYVPSFILTELANLRIFAVLPCKGYLSLNLLAILLKAHFRHGFTR